MSGFVLKKSVMVWSGAGLLLAGGTAFAVRAAISAEQIPRTPIHMSALPLPTTWNTNTEISATMEWLGSGGDPVHVEFSVSPLQRVVTSHWELGIDPSNDLADPVTDSDVYAVAYWPTSIVSPDKKRLIVAGMTGDDPVLEEWVFSVPRQAGQALKAGPRVEVNAVTPSLPLSYGKIGTLWGMRGSPGHVLCHSHESGALFTVELDTGAVVDVARPSTPVGVLPAEPLLDAPWPNSWGPRLHDTLGVVYTLTTTSDALPDFDETANISYLLIVDTDADGTIDSLVPMTPFDFDQAGLNDPSRLSD